MPNLGLNVIVPSVSILTKFVSSSRYAGLEIPLPFFGITASVLVYFEQRERLSYVSILTSSAISVFLLDDLSTLESVLSSDRSVD